jgi:hypothetical protein
VADAPPSVRTTSGQYPAPPRDRWFELVVVNDARQTAARGAATETFAADTINIVHGLLREAPFADRVLTVLTGQVTLDGVEPFSPLQVGEEFDESDLLDQVDTWVTTADLPSHDHVQLLTARDLTGDTTGLGNLGRMCFDGSSSLVQATFEPAVAATISAHEIGHSFGMVHDGLQNTCPQGGFIMAAVASSSGPQATSFSDCSIDDMDLFLAGEGAECLDLRPVEGSATCGDGVLDDGEACDCGPSGCDDIDPCCDPTTCQLVDGATCSALEPCCTDSCGVVTDTEQVCRDRHPDCDVPETCDGIHPGCPSDEIVPAGTTCRDERGWQGVCHDAACESYEATCADIDDLFDGVTVAWNRVCQPTQARQACGDIICSFDGQGCTSVSVGNSRVRVPDGTECGTGQQCLEGACVPSSDLDVTDDLCPFDPSKVTPGVCGCGAVDLDRDSDGTADCLDLCPLDADKVEPGECGCGEAEPAVGETCDGAPPEDEEPGGACACSGGGPGGAWLVLPILLAARRRR